MCSSAVMLKLLAVQMLILFGPECATTTTSTPPPGTVSGTTTTDDLEIQAFTEDSVNASMTGISNLSKNWLHTILVFSVKSFDGHQNSTCPMSINRTCFEPVISMRINLIIYAGNRFTEIKNNVKLQY